MLSWAITLEYVRLAGKFIQWPLATSHGFLMKSIFTSKIIWHDTCFDFFGSGAFSSKIWNAHLTWVISFSMVFHQLSVPVSWSIYNARLMVHGTSIPNVLSCFLLLERTAATILSHFVKLWGAHHAKAACSTSLLATAYSVTSMGFDSLRLCKVPMMWFHHAIVPGGIILEYKKDTHRQVLLDRTLCGGCTPTPPAYIAFFFPSFWLLISESTNTVQ